VTNVQYKLATKYYRMVQKNQSIGQSESKWCHFTLPHNFSKCSLIFKFLSQDSNKYEISSPLKILSHLQRAATLPCEILGSFLGCGLVIVPPCNQLFMFGVIFPYYLEEW